MNKERRLGRGLEALLGRVAQAKENIAAEKGDTASTATATKTPCSTTNGGSETKLDTPVQPTAGAIPPATEMPIEIINNQSALVSDTNAANGSSSSVLDEPRGVTANTGSGSSNSAVQGSHLRLFQQPAGDSSITKTPVATPPSSQPVKPSADRAAIAAAHSDSDVVQVNVALIEPNPFQPRKDFGESELSDLAESITAHGLLQPIVCRRVDDTYQLIAGERRLRAAQKAGWDEVPVRVIETDERGAAELAIVENLQRKDLNALEKAASFRRYIKQHRCTQEQLALRLRIDRSTVANFMRLLELPEPVQQSLAAGKITQGHARALLPLGEEREQIAFCRRIEREGLSVRKTETMVQETIKKADADPLSLSAHSQKTENTKEHLSALEQEFRSGLGTKVTITQGKGGSGKLVIHFNNHEEFNRVKEQILGVNQPQAKAG